MPDTTPTPPPPFRFIDEDEFYLSARLLPQLPATLSITIEGSDEPQSAHVPVGDLPKVLAGIAEAAGLVPARQVLGTTDQQPETAPAEVRDRVAQALSDADGWVWAAGFDKTQSPSYQGYLRQADAVLAAPTDQAAEAHRLALSDALGLGTGAPWDAIRDRAAELRKAREQADMLSAELTRRAPMTGEYANEIIRLRAEVERLRTDRAAALREAAAIIDQRASAIDAFSSSDFGEEARAVRELAAVANDFRRMADEAQQPDTIGLCGACGDPREGHHHGYERTPHAADEAQQPEAEAHQ